MRTPLLIAVLASIAPVMHAQRMVSAPPRFAPGHNRGAHARAFFYPLAFSDPFYSDYLSSTGSSVVSQPPVIVVQASPATTVPVPERAPSQPLMIELQGGRYVRVSGEGTSGTGSDAESKTETKMIDLMPDSARQQQRSAGAGIHAGAAGQLARTILVFDDGHREEVSEYTIADGVLYARSDYYANGSWTRKIKLSSLNLPETVSSNQARGLRFQLPSAPNEVIVGP